MAVETGRVNRGGGWINDTAHCRTAYRGYYQPMPTCAPMVFAASAIFAAKSMKSLPSISRDAPKVEKHECRE